MASMIPLRNGTTVAFIRFLVVPFADLPSGTEQVGPEMPPHKPEIDDVMPDPEPFAVPGHESPVGAGWWGFIATPIGYQTNTLVYGAGGYRFSAFLRVGVPMNLIAWLLGSLIIPLLWPFTTKG